MPNPVLFVCGRDPRVDLGGHAGYVRAHGLAARAAGFHPHVLCVGAEADASEEPYGAVRRVRSPFFSRRTHSLPRHAPALARAAAETVRAWRDPVLVHGFGVWAYVGVLLERALAPQGRAVVPVASAYTAYGHQAIGRLRGVRRWHGPRRRVALLVEAAWVHGVVLPYERRAYLGSRRVWVNYEAVRRALLARYRRAAVRRTPYAAESAFHDVGARRGPPPAVPGPPGAPVVVAVSRQDPRKGVDVLLRALARLPRSGVSFRAALVGGGVLLGEHRALAARLGLSDRVVLPGWVPDPTDWLAGADAFVLPSLQEGSGSLAVLEAFQAGVPVVASRVDGVPEDVVDGDNGLLVRPGDAGALASALGRLLRDEPLRRRLARRARESFERGFSAARFADAVRTEYAALGVLP